MKKCFCAFIAFTVLLGAYAFAETFAGITAAQTTVSLSLPEDGSLSSVAVIPGETVSDGDTVASLNIQKVFASENGSVARLFAKEGDRIDGDVMEIAPRSRYLIYCSVSKGASTPETRFVRIGETAYVSCTSNGTHRAVGRIIAIDGENFNLEVYGGELYIGETVYLYQSDDFKSTSRIGIGTVVEAPTETLTAGGRILSLNVTEGDPVERGQLLYTVEPSDGALVTSPVSGIVTEVQPDDNIIAVIAPFTDMCVEFSADEYRLENTRIGDTVQLFYLADATETPYSGTITDISRISNSDGYIVRIKPDLPPQKLGLSVEIHTN